MTGLTVLWMWHRITNQRRLTLLLVWHIFGIVKVLYVDNLSAAWISDTVALLVQFPLIKPTQQDTDACVKPKMGWVYLASLLFDALPLSSVSLHHSLPLSPFLVPFADKKCLTLPEEWESLQGHCKHSKQGTTTPLSCPWFRTGTEILTFSL